MPAFGKVKEFERVVPISSFRDTVNVPPFPPPGTVIKATVFMEPQYAVPNSPPLPNWATSCTDSEYPLALACAELRVTP